MPRVTADSHSGEFPAETRLVNAISATGVAIGHRCGGFARCTTCRVTFAAGEPAVMTAAEFDKLHEAGLYGQYRLACQILCEQDMDVTAGMTKESQGWTDTGPEPTPTVQPEAVWHSITELEARR